jgi:hypothetical protein
MGFGSITKALGFEQTLATQVADVFFDAAMTFVPGPWQVFRVFKALKYAVKFAKAAENFRKPATKAELSLKQESLGRAMLTAGNKFAGAVVKEAREKIEEEATEVVKEGAVALVDAAFGESVAETVETGLDIASHIESAQSLFSAVGGKGRSRRKMKQGMPHFGLNKGGTIQTATRSDLDAATLSMEFGVADGQSYQTFLNKVKTGGILTASHGFDINEFGLLDESTATLQECTRTVNSPTGTLTCGGSNCGSGCTPSSGAWSGTISNGAGNYANNANCWWLLATSPGVEIRISFPSFDTQSDRDYVTIYTCNSASCSPHTQILRQSGSLNANNVYTSTTGFLKVIFTSDSSSTLSGFTGSWSLASSEFSYESEDCKVIYVGSPVLLNARIVILRQEVSTEDKKQKLLAAVSRTCGFIAADAITSRVQIGQTVDIPCGDALCSQVDFSIAATTNEVRTALQSKMSLQSLRTVHSSLGNVRRESVSSGIVSVEICDGQCGACPLGKYGTVSGSDLPSCTDCPGGKYAASQPATSLASCVSCPSDSHSPSGSYNIWNCSCNQGFILSATHTCTICESGKYSTSLSTSCLTCPSNTMSPQGSTAVDDCKCTAGKSGPGGGPCTACEAGKYSATITSTSVCANCEAGKYSDIVGADTADTCSDCDAGKYSAAVGADTADTCSDCAAGKYSDAVGAAAMGTCSDCAAGKYSDAVGADTEDTCSDCQAGKFSAVMGANTAETCSECEAGKYAAEAASNVCTNCQAGKFSAAAGAIVASTCADCPQGKTSAAGSDLQNDCTLECAPGWTGAPGACTQCSIGTYKATTGSAACVACPANSHNSETGQSSCPCNAGFTGPNGDCSSCVAGKFKATSGSAACENCEAGKYAAAASAVCTNCEAGTYKVSAGVGDCLMCPSQSSSIPGSHFCPCNAGSVSTSAAKSCVCDAGFTLDSASSAEICIPCPTGRCKPSPGDHSCDTSFCPLETPKISPNGGVFTGFVEIMVTAKVPMVVTLNAAEPVCSSSHVKNHTLALLSSTTVKARACFESRESGVSSASFTVLPGSVVKISFTMDGINADEFKKDVIDNFVEALADELGIAKERISNLNFKNSRRRLLMSFELVASSVADAKLLSTMVYRYRHTQSHVTITKQLHIMISVCSSYLVLDVCATSSFT